MRGNIAGGSELCNMNAGRDLEGDGKPDAWDTSGDGEPDHYSDLLELKEVQTLVLKCSV